MGDKPKALIVGSGIGGLATAARLAQEGRLDVEVVERMSFPGGRFTQHDHDGFAVPTGAVHMIPHGRKGPMAKLLFNKRSKGGLDLKRHGFEFLPTGRYAGWVKNGKHRAANGPIGVMRWFTMKDKLNLPRLLSTRARKPWTGAEGEEPDGDEWMRRYFSNDMVDFLDAFANFAISLRFSQMPASTVVRMLQNCFWLDRPSIPKGGCKGAIVALRKDLRENGAKVRMSQEVAEILPGDAEETTKNHRFAVSLRRRGRQDPDWIGADAIVFNGGHPNLIKALSDDFTVDKSVLQQIEQTQAVGGIGFVFALDDDIPHRDSGVTMLTETERIGGYVLPTFSEPALAPEGKHMMITHQYVPSSDIQSEIAKGREELYEKIPWLADHGEELCVHAYHRNWPCNRSPQGAELPADIGVDGIRLVGDGVKGHGWMMVEGIAANVPHVVDDIHSMTTGNA